MLVLGWLAVYFVGFFASIFGFSYFSDEEESNIILVNLIWFTVLPVLLLVYLAEQTIKYAKKLKGKLKE